jgi:undecaprenyl diphosphate synthase
MRLFRSYLRGETARCVEHGVALRVIGRRDRLPSVLVEEIVAAEEATAAGSTLDLRIAVDYSSRDAILRTALRCATPARRELTPEEFADLLGAVPPVDVFVRTGGEQRLSDFLLWESAYAELFFRKALWPDFRPGDLAEVLAEFRRRERRFGGIEPVPSSEPLRMRVG